MSNKPNMYLIVAGVGVIAGISIYWLLNNKSEKKSDPTNDRPLVNHDVQPDEERNGVPRILRFPLKYVLLPRPERPIPDGKLSDVQRYRCGYPDQEDIVDGEGHPMQENYMFYKNQIPFRPYHLTIDEIHQTWWRNYETLEENHSYIQWLFPIREQGLNRLAHPLQLSEIQLMSKDPECLERLLLSYTLMVDFYGCKLDAKGNLSRSENWEERYANMNQKIHNSLRITRILKCLGEFGFEDLKEKFMTHFIEEIWVNGKIPRCKRSCKEFWLGTLREEETRQKLNSKITELEKTI